MYLSKKSNIGHGYAIIPELRTSKCNDSNNYKFSENVIQNPIENYNETDKIKWSEEEKNLFIKNFLKTPKDFSAIAQNIPTKTSSECVHYYYLSKKKMNYKAMLKNFKPLDPLSKLDLPQRKAAIKAIEKVKNNLHPQKSTVLDNCQNDTSLKRKSKLAKMTEVWIIVDSDIDLKQKHAQKNLKSSANYFDPTDQSVIHPNTFIKDVGIYKARKSKKSKARDS